MTSQRKKTMELSVETKKYNDAETKKLNLINIVLTTSLYISFSFLFLSMFTVETVNIVSLIPGLLLIGLLAVIKHHKKLLYGILVFSILVIILANSYLIDGLLVIINHISQAIGVNTGRILPEYKYAASGQSIPVVASIAWAFLANLIAIGSFYIVKFNQTLITMLVLIGIVSLQLFFHVEAALWLNLLFIATVFLNLFKSTTQSTSGERVSGTQKSNVFLVSSSILLFFLVVASVVLLMINPVTDYEKNHYVQKTDNYISGKIDAARYEKGQPDTLTQGDFTKLSKLDLSDEPALEVIMSEPTSLYLRGYVGSDYTASQWTDLESDTYYDNHGLFYWLNDEGFSPLNQLSLIDGLQPEDDQVGEEVQVTVNNTHANSHYLYTPYNLRSPKIEFTDAQAADDSTLQSRDFLGKRLYTYDVTSDVVTKYPALANHVYQSGDDENKANYLNLENHYNEYVYNTYTKVPDNAATIFSIQLDKDESSEGRHLPYEQATELVRDYLNETITYRVNPDPLPEGGDFIVHLLERSQEGYAAHYATAATLMFRYLGIPARYVEGYLVTPDDIKDKKAYEMIELQGTNAHAWTEIYVDQVGWLPVEVTPPYYDVMEPTDLSDYPEGEADEETSEAAGEHEEGSPEASQHITDRDDETSTSDAEDDEETPKNWSLLVLSLVLLIIILAYFVYVIYNRVKLHKMIQAFAGPDLNDAAIRMFAYTLTLLHYDGVEKRGGSLHAYENDLQEKYGAAFVAEFSRSIQVNQAAIYSGRPITETDYETVKAFKKLTLKKVIQSKNVFQRLKMRLWDFIY